MHGLGPNLPVRLQGRSSLRQQGAQAKLSLASITVARLWCLVNKPPSVGPNSATTGTSNAADAWRKAESTHTIASSAETRASDCASARPAVDASLPCDLRSVL